MSDKEGAFAICSYNWPEGPCADISVTNNIAGGVTYAGFVVPGNECGEDAQFRIRDNVAHSSDGDVSGEGLIVFPSKADYPSHKNCYQASHFSGYKLTMAGANSYYSSEKVVMSDMTLVDNHYGFAVNIICPGDYAENEIVIRDSQIFGDSISPDCPEDGGFCYEPSKYGMIIGGATRGGGEPHNPVPVMRPHHKIMSDSCW